MSHNGHILVQSGLKPVHSFDVFGVIVNQLLLGKQYIRLFQQIREKEGISDKRADEIIRNYQGVITGEPSAIGPRKKEYVDALKQPVLKYPDLRPDYQSTLLPDSIDAMREIISAKEEIIIFSTGDNSWLKTELPQDITANISGIYSDDKTRQEAFKKVYNAEKAKGHIMVTHTADELPELEAAYKTRLFNSRNGLLIFIDRNINSSASSKANFSEAVDVYIRDLRKVCYGYLVDKPMNYIIR